MEWIHFFAFCCAQWFLKWINGMEAWWNMLMSSKTTSKSFNLEASAPLDVFPCRSSTNHKDHQNVQQEHNDIHFVLFLWREHRRHNVKIFRSRGGFWSKVGVPVVAATALRIGKDFVSGVRSPELYGVVRTTGVQSPPSLPPPTSTFCNAELRRPPCSVLRTSCNFCVYIGLPLW